VSATLLDAKIEIFTWENLEPDTLDEFKEEVLAMVDEIKGKCVSGSLKINWLTSKRVLICVIEWCERK
jgi:hypothetical protein